MQYFDIKLYVLIRYGDGYVMIGFSNGFLVVVSTKKRDIGQVHACKYIVDTISWVVWQCTYVISIL